MPRLTVLVALILSLAAPAAAQEGRAPRTITATGEGRAAAAPDMATIMLGVGARARDAASALSAMSETTARLLETLSQAGVEAREVQTGALSLRPLRDAPAGQERLSPSGYEAESVLRIRVRRLDELGGLLDRLARAGGNRVSSLSFGLNDPASLADRARRMAVADALANARLYAEAAGVRAGDLLAVAEEGAGARPLSTARSLAAEAGVPVAGGEIEIVHRVTVTVAIAGAP